MPQGVQGQVIIGGEQGYVVRWEFSYSSWTLFTCEVEMLLHVVSTAGTQLFSLYFQTMQKINESHPKNIFSKIETKSHLDFYIKCRIIDWTPNLASVLN